MTVSSHAAVDRDLDSVDHVTPFWNQLQLYGSGSL
jgi:hypothetical protein